MLLLGLGVARPAESQCISLAALGTAYVQSFDALSSVAGTTTNALAIPGWFMSESGVSANQQYAVGSGAGNAGDTYSFGATGSPDRALGTLRSGSLVPTLGACFTNNTGATITSLAVAYTGEQWRLGAEGRFDRLDVEMSTDATSLSTGSWNGVAGLSFVSPISFVVGQKDGNASASRAGLSAQLTALGIANGATFWLRWVDADATGPDDGLAVDEFSLTPQGVGPDAPVVATCPASLAVSPGIGGSAAVSASDADDRVTNASIASGAVAGITLPFTAAPAIGAALLGNLTVAGSVPSGTYPLTLQFSNDDVPAQAATCSTTVTVAPIVAGSVRIHDIQGAAHLSAFDEVAVGNVPGVVTAVRSNGFFMEDWLPDANPATSEGIFVFTNSAPPVAVGQSVMVSGTVLEFRPGNDATGLTVTQITSPTVLAVAPLGALPPAVIIGSGGRIPPKQVIDDDAAGSVETGGTFDPSTDGIDFFESLEGMRVTVNDAVAVGRTDVFGTTREIWVVGDHGANAVLRTPRGGLIAQSGDFNPERILLASTLIGGDAMPLVSVGARASSVSGVLEYAFTNYRVLVTSPPIFELSDLAPEITPLVGSGDRLSVANFNVENLDPADGAATFQRLAAQIVTNLRSPDVIALIEVQDNSGATNNTIVDASLTLQMLTTAIVGLGGPAYQYRQIDPVNNQDGGEPGGNIRVVFLFNPARVGFVDRPGGGPIVPNAVLNNGGIPQLQFSPGRIGPGDPAFVSTRKSLAGEFLFNGHRLFLIANHFNSRGGDQPLFGRFQPPTLVTEAQRIQQASVVAAFVQQILAIDSNAKVIVLGDFNDYDFSASLGILETAGVAPLADLLPPNERYNYVFEGNSLALDHILVSRSLLAGAAAEYDVVHVNAEFAVQTSDHDPDVARFTLPAPHAPLATIEDTRVVGTKIFTIRTAYTGTMQVAATGLVPATRLTGTVALGQSACFAFAVPAGAHIARLRLFNSETQGGSSSDLDLKVYQGQMLLGVSTGGTSDELVDLPNPAPGTYTACVVGSAPLGGSSSFTLSSWVVGPAVGPQTLRAAGPSRVYLGGTASIAMSWNVPAGKRYLGVVQYKDGATVLGSTLLSVDNVPVAPVAALAPL